MSDGTPVWVYFLIPVLSGLVGYATNVLAVWMTFNPTEFSPVRVWQPKGQPFGLFGWQGIVPAKSVVMTEMLCDVFIAKVLNVDEIFGRVDATRVATLVDGKLNEQLPDMMERVVAVEAPAIWRALSPHVKSAAQAEVSAVARTYIAALLAALQGDVLNVVNIRSMVARQVEENKALLSELFLSVGAREFVFVKRSGLYFGFLFGLIQVAVYIFYKGEWVLPVAGFIVGYATNWFALKIVFEPAVPLRLGPFTLQGLFLKRQQEAAGKMSSLCKTHFLPQAELWQEVFQGEWSHKWHALLTRTTDTFVKQQLDATAARRLATALLLDEALLARILRLVTEEVAAALPSILPATYDYMDACMDIETTMRDALQGMPPDEFINILRPVFQQDEIKLIIVGGILGAAAGAFQQFAIFNFV